MPKVNPDILSWARRTAGLTPEEAAEKLKLRPARGVSAVDRLEALEVGDDMPTRPMLEKMAKQYRRPLLTFYLSAEPRRGDRGQDFRSLPEGHVASDEAILDALIRDIRARQSMVRAVLEDEEEAAPLSFVGSKEMADGVPSVLSSIRETLPVDLLEFRSQPSSLKAFGLLRGGVEAAGVFVLLRGNLGSYHTAIGLQAFRGFALADPVAPFVVINDQDSQTAWSFTLLHELSHVWLGQTGVSGEGADLAIERFCNDVAGEFLLPTKDIKEFLIDEDADMEVIEHEITEFARERNLSSSMVAYRLYRVGAIDQGMWRRLSNAFRNKWLEERRKQRERTRDEEAGPDPNVVRAHRLGDGLLELVGRMMNAGALTTSKAGMLLGVKGKQVQAVLDAGGHGGTR
jgi:Zn-dependent peptidase ImmA (M78 family)